MQQTAGLVGALTVSQNDAGQRIGTCNGFDLTVLTAAAHETQSFGS